MTIVEHIKQTQPTTLDEAINVFLEEPEGAARDAIIGILADETEDGWKAKIHGRVIRNEWGLWHGSELAQWFAERGIFHADDMSGIILTSVYREFNDEEINLNKQIEYYRDYWGEEKCEKMKKNFYEKVEEQE